LALLDSVPRHG